MLGETTAVLEAMLQHAGEYGGGGCRLCTGAIRHHLHHETSQLSLLAWLRNVHPLQQSLGNDPLRESMRCTVDACCITPSI